MFQVKDVESKITPAKKNIKISGVRVSNNSLLDEEGDIIEKLYNVVGDDEFTIKITLEIEDDEDFDDVK